AGGGGGRSDEPPEIFEISLEGEFASSHDLSKPAVMDPVTVNLAESEPLCDGDVLVPIRIP
ncbi:MAG TPA: hypothetical protein VGO86_13660, partial [Candidatus Dormibacteraeota bacterium]